MKWNFKWTHCILHLVEPFYVFTETKWWWHLNTSGHVHGHGSESQPQPSPQPHQPPCISCLRGFYPATTCPEPGTSLPCRMRRLWTTCRRRCFTLRRSRLRRTTLATIMIRLWLRYASLGLRRPLGRSIHVRCGWGRGIEERRVSSEDYLSNDNDYQAVVEIWVVPLMWGPMGKSYNYIV